jgi:hypothetical protein
MAKKKKDLLTTLRELMKYGEVLEEESRDHAVELEEALSERAREVLVEMELRAPFN